MPEKYVRRDGLPILLRHTGPTTLPESPPRLSEGPVIVCLHDAGLQSSVFGEFLACVEAAGGSAVAFDLPGHGRSGSLDSLPSIGAMAEMARWVSEWCGVRSPVLLGHGMGSLVALDWSEREDASVEALVLCGVGAALEVSDEAVDTMRLVTCGKAPRPFDPRCVCKESGPDRMRQAYMEGIQTDPRATLVDLEASQAWTRDYFHGEQSAPSSDTTTREARCPARVVAGASEPESARTRAEQFSQRRRDCSIHTIPEAAHFLPLERAQALADEVLSFSRAAGSGGTGRAR